MPLLVRLCQTRSVVCLSSFVVVLWWWGCLCVNVIVKSFAYDIVYVGRCGGSVVHVDDKECGGTEQSLGRLLGKFLVR